MILRKWGKKMKCFEGDLQKKSNIVFAIAKLRCELTDTSSITITQDNIVGMSPLMVLHDGSALGLVQIVMLKQTWVNSQKLWVPQAGRRNWYWAKSAKSSKKKQQTDDAVGFHEAMQTESGPELRDSLENNTDYPIEQTIVSNGIAEG